MCTVVASGWVTHPLYPFGMKGVWGFTKTGGGGAEIMQAIEVGELTDIFMACISQGLTAPPNYLNPVPTQPQIRAELCINTKKWPTPANRGRLVDSWSVRACWRWGSCVMFHSLITILLSFSLWCWSNTKQHLIICYMWKYLFSFIFYFGNTHWQNQK